MTVPVFNPPDLGFEQVSFDLVVPQDSNRMHGRRTESRLFGTAYWAAQYQFTWQDERGYGKADAFMRRVKSKGGVFRAYDAFRPRPIEAGQTPLDWTPTLAEITDANTVVISGVANNFQFREGDPIEFRMDTLISSLHSIDADVQADGSGDVTLSIVPALDLQNFTTAAQVIFEKPSCLMQPFGWQATKSWASRNPSFSAEEVFFYDLSQPVGPAPSVSFIADPVEEGTAQGEPIGFVAAKNPPEGATHATFTWDDDLTDRVQFGATTAYSAQIETGSAAFDFEDGAIQTAVVSVQFRDSENDPVGDPIERNVPIAVTEAVE